jgi:hypothetical protein
MAERRMFAKTIVDSDAFLDMPVTARLLYYDLSMRADDDGFINSPKKIQRMIGASDDDLKVLIAKKFIIPFESGVVVIKHWRIHNYIQKDRYKPTVYKEEMAKLEIKDNNSYSLETKCIQNGYSLDTQVRLGKDSIGKDSIDTDSVPEKNPKSKYGEYQRVLLTDKEYEKLGKDFSNREELITYLDEYIERTGYKTKSHYLCIRGWVKRAIEEDKARQNKINNSNNKPSNYYKDNNSAEYNDLDRFYN